MDLPEIHEKLPQKYLYIGCVWLPANLWACICLPCGLPCCQSGVSSCLSRRECLWRSWMTKPRWGFSASLYRGELMQCHYPFFFVLVFPTLCEEKLRERRYWRRTHGHVRDTVTGGLIHSSIIYRKFTSQTFSALAQKGACGWTVNPEHKKSLCLQVRLGSESCQCDNLNFCH